LVALTVKPNEVAELPAVSELRLNESQLPPDWVVATIETPTLEAPDTLTLTLTFTDRVVPRGSVTDSLVELKMRLPLWANTVETKEKAIKAGAGAAFIHFSPPEGVHS
jgi:hypothetical protein